MVPSGGDRVGRQRSAMASGQRFQAAASYWLVGLPRMGRRIVPWIGSGTTCGCGCAWVCATTTPRTSIGGEGLAGPPPADHPALHPNQRVLVGTWSMPASPAGLRLEDPGVQLRHQRSPVQPRRRRRRSGSPSAAVRCQRNETFVGPCGRYLSGLLAMPRACSQRHVSGPSPGRAVDARDTRQLETVRPAGVTSTAAVPSARSGCPASPRVRA